MEKEQWINEVMGSIKNQNPVEANPFLHTRVMAKLKSAEEGKMPVRWVFALSLCIAVLLCFNVVLFTKSSAGSNGGDGIQQVIAEYSLTNTDIYSTGVSNN